MKTWLEQYIEEEKNTEYCTYCMEPRGSKFSCCSEVHFIEFKDLPMQDQIDIACDEWEIAFGDKK